MLAQCYQMRLLDISLPSGLSLHLPLSISRTTINQANLSAPAFSPSEDVNAPTQKLHLPLMSSVLTALSRSANVSSIVTRSLTAPVRRRRLYRTGQTERECDWVKRVSFFNIYAPPHSYVVSSPRISHCHALRLLSHCCSGNSISRQVWARRQRLAESGLTLSCSSERCAAAIGL